ncbi:hypothetical protein ACWKSP_18610 [Micromonosporaceae bacterium Da 78-11]
MNLLKTPLRRATALVAGSFLGLAGAVAIAAPASAHYPSVSGSAPCVTGDNWKIDWSVGNDYGLDATVDTITVKDQDGKELALTGDIAADGKVVPPKSDNDPALQVHGATAVTSASVKKATLTVILKWTDGYKNDGKPTGDRNDHNAVPLTTTVEKPTKACDKPSPSPSVSVSTSTSASPSASASVSTSPSASVSTSASATPTPTTTTPELPVPTPSTTDEPAEFTPIVEMDCTTITIGMDNPADGIEWVMGFDTPKGEKREITVKPGEKKVEKFSATAGFTVKVTLSVTVDGKTYSDFATVPYTQPTDCDTSGEGGGLPVTGAAAGGIAGGAVALLALGGVLFFLARRRKVKFTA